ncbi:unnamed protein product [Brugia timori]|uniref:Uncharacterized protein n=1 Tax=Brugia timori TaxID=42155 RepID=A0A3P7SSB2_9BILA|nr:unnamed protein product [Brugia timori]
MIALKSDIEVHVEQIKKANCCSKPIEILTQKHDIALSFD